MGQVPTTYLIVGYGRLARHLRFYLDHLKLDPMKFSFRQWRRADGLEDLQKKWGLSTHILLAIRDDELNSFVQQSQNFSVHLSKQPVIIHFSGATSVNGAFAAHPLMTFTHELLPIPTYMQIPFIIDREGPDFSTLLPGLPNPHYRIPKTDRAYYHSLCVLSGNFTTLLWQKFFYELQTRWQIPAQAAHLFLQNTAKHLTENSQQALTGPLARGDDNTIQRNLRSLKENSDPYLRVYEAFVSAFAQQKGVVHE